MDLLPPTNQPVFHTLGLCMTRHWDKRRGDLRWLVIRWFCEIDQWPSFRLADTQTGWVKILRSVSNPLFSNLFFQRREVYQYPQTREYDHNRINWFMNRGRFGTNVFILSNAHLPFISPLKCLFFFFWKIFYCTQIKPKKLNIYILVEYQKKKIRL